MMKTVLTIAGSDSIGGAGIQADIKTITVNGAYAMSAITALTAQNTQGVFAVSEVTPEFLAAQIDAVCTDIFPDAVKIGMVASAELIRVIEDRLTAYPVPFVVVDPVLVATSGARLIQQNALSALKSLLSRATVITPNLPEAEVLAEMEISCAADQMTAARLIGERYGCAVLCKGGHGTEEANDLLYANGECSWFYGERIDNPNTHGTGCTLSSAIAVQLANGADLPEAVRRAKAYVSGCLSAMLDLGHGSGPMDHAFGMRM